ncbi:hypothetical protein HispidOSU_027293 [Sigmodon hispidus]
MLLLRELPIRRKYFRIKPLKCEQQRGLNTKTTEPHPNAFLLRPPDVESGGFGLGLLTSAFTSTSRRCQRLLLGKARYEQSMAPFRPGHKCLFLNNSKIYPSACLAPPHKYAKYGWRPNSLTPKNTWAAPGGVEGLCD